MTENQMVDISKMEENGEVSESKVNEMRLALRKDSEVVNLLQKIDIKDSIQLLQYGSEPAKDISTFSDKILSSIRSNSMEESSVLIKQLGKIMDKFDMSDLKEEPKGIFAKLFHRGEKLIEKIFAKYQTMGGELEKVYVEIKKYQDEMITSTKTLEELYEQNFTYYNTLEKYVVAGEMKLEEIKQNILPQYVEKASSGDQLALVELEGLKNNIESLEQRVYDLQMAGMVFFTNAPQVRLLQRGSNKLIAKINSAFVTTIPIFKSGVIQAVQAKRQKLVANSLSELDRRTNELLLKNAQNTASQSVDIARLAGQSSVKIETIEESWNIIMRGMEETKAIEEENARLREEGTRKILEIKENNLKKVAG